MTFEKLSGPIYPAYLHLGDYAIALEPELLQSLKATVDMEPPLFLAELSKQVGRNRYLKGMIEAAIQQEGSPETLASALKKALVAL